MRGRALLFGARVLAYVTDKKGDLTMQVAKSRGFYFSRVFRCQVRLPQCGHFIYLVRLTCIAKSTDQ